MALLDGVGTTDHITHKLPRQIELAPDRARRVEYSSVALRQTLSIPVVAAADDGGHGNVPRRTLAQHRCIPRQHPRIAQFQMTEPVDFMSVRTGII